MTKKVISNINNKTVNKKANTLKKQDKKVSKAKLNVKEIPMKEALTRVHKNQELYNKPKENLSNTRQQKFNFEKSLLEDEMDNTFLTKKKKKTPPKVKVEEIPIKKALNKTKKEDKFPIITMIGMAIVIILLGGILIVHYATFNHDKVKIVTKEKEVPPENILFLGDSITYRYDIEKYYPKRHVVNSGIDGNQTQDILDSMKKRVYDYNPSKIFLLIGTNDLNNGKDKKEIMDNIKELIKEIKENRKEAKIYIESIYPVDEERDTREVNGKKNKDIKDINKEIKEYCKKEKITYIDMYKELIDDEGNLRDEFTKEGLHLTTKGYDKVTFVLKKYIEED